MIEGSGMSMDERVALVRRLLGEVRVGSLSTLNKGAPYGSMAPFCADDKGNILVHLTRLAQHTRNIEEDPRVSLLVCDTDGPDKDPIALPRLNMGGQMETLERDSEEYNEGKATYLARFPSAKMVFQLPDFTLYRLAPDSIHLVAGFGKAFNLKAEDLAGS